MFLLRYSACNATRAPLSVAGDHGGAASICLRRDPAARQHSTVWLVGAQASGVKCPAEAPLLPDSSAALSGGGLDRAAGDAVSDISEAKMVSDIQADRPVSPTPAVPTTIARITGSLTSSASVE